MERSSKNGMENSKEREQSPAVSKAERRKALIQEFRREYLKSGGKLLSIDEIIRMVKG